MSLSQEQLDQIRDLQGPFAAWFSIEEIVKRDRELLASHFIHRDSERVVASPHAADDVYRKLDGWAARLMEQELRLYERRIAEKYLQQSLTPTAADDSSVLGIVTGYLESVEQTLRTQISSFTKHEEQDWEKSWSKVRQTAKRLRIELSITLRLNGELTMHATPKCVYHPMPQTQ